ncbi:type II toxin-antitoxin system PemK/MazF family toxin [Nocardioides sp. BP30]|uniref:type II toxin-antitoxin system PemK/MazF family toxin n=1 Tax=Nocardioides sp. BP30 TaxID=3036374 RepID=UPI0024695AA5|nr:type II toxin-antitoxin system PemK/MazF family toxin [Nocardioides sp. BP30]WGL51439.1 type II toxin-antitoxin system PemK/MazF family toxin [Nocardioides sp. BP30]
MRSLLRRLWPTRRFGRPAGDDISYAPRSDGRPQPGEVCWAWVPFEEDATQGKDRPVLIVGTRGSQWLALMLTSKDHDRGALQHDRDGVATDRFGHRWLDIGSGGWDRYHRASEIRLDRLLVLDHVRREGSALDRPTFERAVAAAGLSTGRR